MLHDSEYHDLFRSITDKSLRLISDFKENPPKIPELINQFIELTEQVQNFYLILLKNPEKLWTMQLNYWQDAVNLTQTQISYWLEGKPMPIEDLRFNTDDWLHNPFFNLLSQHYILATQHLNALLDQMDYENETQKKRLKFFTRQYIDALSPANFIHTNPQISAEILETQGKNLLRGMHNLLSDIKSDSTQLAIKMTDTDAFKIGENIAITTGKVIFRNELMELIQYSPQTPTVNSIPLLIIPPWINKYYVLDLSPENSFVRWLVEQGLTVFMISWINPDKTYAKKSLYSYLEKGPRTSIEVIKHQMSVKQVNTLGFCIGGTLLATTLAYNKAKEDKSIHSATFLASMIDFSDPGDISVFIDEQQIKKIENEMKEKGYLAGKFMASSFNALRANDLIWSFFIKNYLRGKNPLPLDILFWNADSTNMPAKMLSQYLRWMYLHNRLAKPGKIKLNHTPIDVSKVDIPTFFLSTQKDHIAPWKTTYLGFQLMSGPKRFVLGGSGHIAGVINPPSANKYNYRTNKSTTSTADEWLGNSEEHEGSWWPEWLKWIKAHSGKMIPAKTLDKLPYTLIMDAPGSYVLKRN